MMRFLIADDHEIVRHGLKTTLLEEFSFADIQEAGNTTELIEKAINSKWTLVISDLAMPGGGGIAALQRIKKCNPDLPVLILSIYPEKQYALRAFSAGASGFLNKDAAGEDLIKAVHKILAGKKYFSDTILAKSRTSVVMKNVPLHESLSEREMEVFRLLALGTSIADIAQILSVNASTVSTYRSRVLEKMNMSSNAELALYAAELGLFK